MSGFHLTVREAAFLFKMGQEIVLKGCKTGVVDSGNDYNLLSKSDLLAEDRYYSFRNLVSISNEDNNASPQANNRRNDRIYSTRLSGELVAFVVFSLRHDQAGCEDY
ncbi:hypothetical protein NPIL_561271 [Nephila pilipes]|uniref:Uncharacterized protein n=1 Tax=Nephila pilipes TaxID=299642 RepID=A0A8X6QZV9_NEPPI|nr:hypothetical protein NPIL_561271 [Nephila pilipes]